ncbi:MAG TPA: hypothetical protein VKA38_06285, partial [Draconibacterium sp.]|nr:hypothetical protein [Draconibacterium sp.]
MKRTFLIFFLLASVNYFAGAQQLVEKEGKYLLNGEPYSGTWVTYFDSGNVKMEAKFKDGLKNGKTYIYFDNGQLNEIRSYKNNKMDGKWVMYNDHNIKISIA